MTLRIADQDHLPWLTPEELFDASLDLVFSEGLTIRDGLNRILDGKLFADDVLSRTNQTPEDVILYKQRLKELDEAEHNLIRKAQALTLKGGVEGQWFAYGRRSPFDDEELIPPQFWGYLKIDWQGRSAASEEFTLKFGGLRCLILQNLTREWRLQAEREMEACEQAIKEGKRQIAPDSNTELKANESQLSVYSRVYIAFDQLPEEVKGIIHDRGGKNKLSKIIWKQMPDVKLSSVERELRNVLKDKV